MSLYIFLDIDGVMVPAKGWKAPPLLEDGFPAFSAKAVSALKTLLAPDAVIMLTSSHKSSFSLNRWKDIFANRGITDVTLKALPHNLANLSRAAEILNWFAANATPEQFIIIDDDAGLNDLPKWIKQKLILTSPFIGLTVENLANANLLQN